MSFLALHPTLYALWRGLVLALAFVLIAGGIAQWPAVRVALNLLAFLATLGLIWAVQLVGGVD